MELTLSKLSNKVVQFDWNDPLHKTKVKVLIPNLNDLAFNVWGDWGPMYDMKLNKSEPIQISYNEEAYSLDQTKLSIHSPALAKVRKKTPFFIMIEDKIKGIKFNIFLDAKFEVGKIEAIRMEDEVVLTTSRLNQQQNLTAV
tara:strand:- start:213 stop:638 length:426 start_codon:yes stop_codon:yes gene_type:complete